MSRCANWSPQMQLYTIYDHDTKLIRPSLSLEMNFVNHRKVCSVFYTEWLDMYVLLPELLSYCFISILNVLCFFLLDNKKIILFRFVASRVANFTKSLFRKLFPNFLWTLVDLAVEGWFLLKLWVDRKFMIPISSWWLHYFLALVAEVVGSPSHCWCYKMYIDPYYI